ncbi:MAG: serine hydrolase domain-containing protein [Propionibacteriaceae bacterium]
MITRKARAPRWVPGSAVVRCIPTVLLSALLALLVLPGSAVADAGDGVRDPDRVNAFLDEAVRAQLAERRIPGAAVVVVSEGRQVAARGYGTADLSTGAPVDPDRTEMCTASVGKMFTSTAVMQLVEQGRVDLDRDVNEYLTEFQVPDTYPGQPVTMRHLLTHTAGFDYVVLGAGDADGRDVESVTEHLVDHLPDRVRPPGEGRVSYDNYGVVLAGAVVEAVTGQRYEEYVGEHVFAAAGMESASQAQPRTDEADLAKGYRVSGDVDDTDPWTQVHGQLGPLTPTGAATTTTATDMGRFMLAQLGQPEHPVLEPDTVQQMQSQQAALRPELPGMGYLWELRDVAGERVVAKDGDMPGFHANLVLLPERDTGIYVVFNGDGDENSAWLAGRELGDQFVSEFFGADGDQDQTDSADDPATVQQTDALAGTYLGRHVSHSEFLGASGLVGGITVEPGTDGTLATHDAMADDPAWAARHWEPVEEGLFREQGGSALLAFGADGESLAISSMPTYSYERLPGWQSPLLHQVVLYGSAAVLAIGLLVLPVLALVRRRRGRLRWPRGARVTRLLWCLTSVALLGYTGAFFTLMGDGAALNETLFLGDSPLLIMNRVLSGVGMLGTLALVVLTPFAWRRRWWRLPGRLGLTLTTLAGIAFLAVCAMHHMIGPGLW